MRKFDLLILDLDGTLVDSQVLLVGLVNRTLVAGGQPPAAAAAVAATIGLPLEEVFRRAAPGLAAPALAELCAAYRRAADAMEFVRQFRLYADVAATLAALRQSGAHLVVGTSKGRATSLDILAHCAIDGDIDAVIGGDSVSRGKPHPEMVEHARRLFPAAAARTLVVGDTSFDIEMGQAAGVATCAVTYGMQAETALAALRPDYLIDRFGALHPLVVGTASV